MADTPNTGSTTVVPPLQNPDITVDPLKQNIDSATLPPGSMNEEKKDKANPGIDSTTGQASNIDSTATPKTNMDSTATSTQGQGVTTSIRGDELVVVQPREEDKLRADEVNPDNKEKLKEDATNTEPDAKPREENKDAKDPEPSLSEDNKDAKKPEGVQSDPTLKDKKPDVKDPEPSLSEDNKDAKPQDAKPQDAKPQDAKPQDAKPRDAKPRDAKPQEEKPNNGPKFFVAPQFSDAYSILGVKRDASPAEIKKAFQKRARETHPDKNVSESPEVKAQAEAEFKKVKDAYDKLTDDKNAYNPDRDIAEQRWKAKNEETLKEQQQKAREQEELRQKQAQDKKDPKSSQNTSGASPKPDDTKDRTGYSSQPRYTQQSNPPRAEARTQSSTPRYEDPKPRTFTSKHQDPKPSASTQQDSRKYAPKSDEQKSKSGPTPTPRNTEDSMKQPPPPQSQKPKYEPYVPEKSQQQQADTSSQAKASMYITLLPLDKIKQEYESFINFQKEAYKATGGKYGLPESFPTGYTEKDGKLSLIMPNNDFMSCFVDSLNQKHPNKIFEKDEYMALQQTQQQKVG